MGEEEIVEVRKLAEYLAINDWKSRMTNIPDKDIQVAELVNTEEGMKVIYDIHPQWANDLFNLQTAYEEIIMQFVKK